MHDSREDSQLNRAMSRDQSRDPEIAAPIQGKELREIKGIVKVFFAIFKARPVARNYRI